MLYLNCSTSSTHFQKGMNAVIVPRAIVLESKLNYTLSHLSTITSSHPLYNAEVYYTNSSQTSS